MAMLLHGVNIGLVEEPFVNVRLVALDALDKLVLTHHERIPAAENESCAASEDTAHVIDSHETAATEVAAAFRMLSSRHFSLVEQGLRCRRADLPRSCGRTRCCRPRDRHRPKARSGRIDQ